MFGPMTSTTTFKVWTDSDGQKWITDRTVRADGSTSHSDTCILEDGGMDDDYIIRAWRTIPEPRGGWPCEGKVVNLGITFIF